LAADELVADRPYTLAPSNAWDLARAVGGDERLPDDLVAGATTATADIGPDQRVPGMYGQELDTPAGADAQTRLLALSGRAA
jgi:hypothetical protein